MLLPSQQREILQTIIEFSCDFCQRTTSRTRNYWAKQLSIVFGHVLASNLPQTITTPSKRSQDASWRSLFFELLIHSHGLHHEAYGSLEAKELWTLDEEFSKELSKRYQVLRTPARKNKAGLTPRRSIIRSGIAKVMGGASLKRNLFKSPFSETQGKQPALTAVAFVQNFLPIGPSRSPANPHTESFFDRETFNKRLRLK
ncbi:hypothetical protein HDU91_002832 [Kappamyces sp. JEL0680]|nr:hypothetical protein HDU91_002832 [Kappamyces sp. JEL0680]